MTTSASVSPRRWLTILMVIAATSALLATVGSAQPTPTDIIVAPGASGAGTVSDPASLSATLESRSIPPGTTVWLRGGTYEETFDSNSDGTQASPITVRPYPGEHAVIDGNAADGGGATVTINGDWQTWRDIEFTNSATARFLVPTQARPGNLNIHGRGVALINNEIHDGGSCVGWWKAAQDSLMYGNLIYDCGYQSTDRAHGHAVYIQNNDGGRKTFEANLVGATYGRSIHIFGSDRVHDVDMFDNVFAGGTSLADETKSTVYIAGDIQDFRFQRNHVYTLSSEAVSFAEADVDVVFDDNRIMTRSDALASLWIRRGDPISGSGNHIASHHVQVRLEPGVSLGNWDDNTYYSTGTFYPWSTLSLWRANTGTDASSTVVSGLPTHVEVTPNRYDADRGMVAVWNGSGASTVAVDLSDILEPGDTYRILGGEDLGGAPLVTGTYTGGSVALPMAGRSVGAPNGGPTPLSWGSEFGVFVVMGGDPEPVDPGDGGGDSGNGGGDDPGDSGGSEPRQDSTPTCRGEAATIVARSGVTTVGTDGRDVIVGTSGPDVIRAGAGDDLICGLGGADEIHGNGGDDTILPGGGNDVVRAGRGDDTVLASAGADAVWGQGGGDSIRGGAGNDAIRGGSGADVLAGGKGSDVLRGGKGVDAVSGNAGRDDCLGGPGIDVIAGCP